MTTTALPAATRVPTGDAPAGTPVATVTPLAGLQPFAPEDGDWETANGGIRNTRSRPGGFDRSAGETLEVAWEHPLTAAGPYGYAAGAPAIAAGVVYVQSLGGNVTALDLETGDQRWQFETGIGTAGPSGPAHADGRIFIAGGGARLQALNAATGELLWESSLEKDGYQPIAAGDMVIVGTGNQAHIAGNSGYVHSFDAATGSRRWSFQVVEQGFWGNPSVNSGGGVWYPPALDVRRGRLYAGTGNAGPYPGTRDFPNATSRPGPNLYTSAIVALSVENGELDWYHQVVEHGLFDHDFQSSPILVDADVDGATRHLVIGAGKVGEVIAFDADTTAIVWETAVGVHENDQLRAIPANESVLVYPGVFGGVETPMATDGRYLYVPVVNMPTLHTATGHGAGDGSSALLNASRATSVRAGTGELVALDVSSGELIWRRALDSAIFGGATLWGDHVYTSTYSGQIYGFHRETGVPEFIYDTGGGINAWPAVSEEWMIWPIGLGPMPRVIAFHVTPPATPAAGVSPTTTATP